MSYFSTSTVFSFILNDRKLLAFLQSIGNEFQTMALCMQHSVDYGFAPVLF